MPELGQVMSSNYIHPPFENILMKDIFTAPIIILVEDKKTNTVLIMFGYIIP